MADLPTGSNCTFCKHTYMEPCHGKKESCSNAIWIRCGRDVEKYKREVDKLFVPKAKQPERIDKPTVDVKPKKSRVRL